MNSYKLKGLTHPHSVGEEEGNGGRKLKPSKRLEWQLLLHMVEEYKVFHSRDAQ